MLIAYEYYKYVLNKGLCELKVYWTKGFINYKSTLVICIIDLILITVDMRHCTFTDY